MTLLSLIIIFQILLCAVNNANEFEIRGKLLINGVALEYNGENTGDNSKALSIYKTAICDHLEKLRKVDALYKYQSFRCIPGDEDAQSSEFSIWISMAQDIWNAYDYPSSMSIQVALFGILLSSSNEINNYIKFDVTPYGTIVFLYGSIKMDDQYLKPNTFDNNSPEFKSIEKNICTAIRERWDQNPLLHSVAMRCGLLHLSPFQSKGHVFLILSNDGLSAVGLALNHSIVALAVQNAILREPLQWGGITFISRVELPDFITQVTYYMFRGPMESGGRILKYNSEEKAKMAPEFNGAIEKICAVAYNESRRTKVLLMNEFRCELLAYDPQSYNVTVLFTAATKINFWYEYQERIADVYPFKLPDEYKASVIYDEPFQPQTEESNNKVAFLCQAQFTEPKQAINSKNDLLRAFDGMEARACRLYAHATTDYGKQVTLQHQCRVLSFDPINYKASIRVTITNEQFIQYGLSDGDVIIESKANNVNLSRVY